MIFHNLTISDHKIKKITEKYRDYDVLELEIRPLLFPDPRSLIDK